MLLRKIAFSCTIAALFAVVVASPFAQAGPVAGVDPGTAKLLAGIRAADKGQLAVSEEDGRFLRVLVGATNARQVLEIGAASGYSAIWIGMGLRQTGGKLTTIEFDPVRAKEAAANVQRAGLSDIVRVVHGDAFQEIPKVTGTFDLVFLDAWKPDYKKFFEIVFPRVNPGGLFLAHNVINKKNDMLDFLAAIEKHPLALNTTVSPGHEGISITY
ncbi:MAG TPA: O-methyltransferase, partial [Vicinamibacterales bacterium]|nr:O-methyltransferase [Vicinamibacterales bacterium]